MPKPSLLLVLPIYNEETDLERSMRRLFAYANERLGGYNWRIMVGDNASTDRSPQIYRRLAEEDRRFTYLRIEQKGRGRILKKIWLEEPFDFSLYMDLDLSTDVQHIKQCVDKLATRDYQLCIGSRLMRGAKVIGRNLKREVLSRMYICIVKLMFPSKLSDYQCGFKGITKEAALLLLPHIEDPTWFFDSELLLLAERLGLPIYQEPVIWRDDPGSTVKIWKTATDDLAGLIRLRRTKPWKQIDMSTWPS
ncbi:glycosyltransferase [Patescibacteria group bacterium]|nr:glycosyltransferase [Patescibacteria group bacterium]